MSRTQLHRKLKALTDLPPHMFIRFIRLKHAAKLLRKHTGNITEIAYNVGFNSPAHFAKAFREQFGKSPSEYAKI
jgi:AraC-like DNA-binding protein